jgi:hypothetical protein
MTNQHPITPPPELVQQWDEECESGNNSEVSNTFDALQWFASKAAQWGANQELDACCAWLLEEPLCASNTHRKLRAARRPKPPSLKEQALALLDKAEDPSWDINDFSIVRKALEQLPE